MQWEQSFSYPGVSSEELAMGVVLTGTGGFLLLGGHWAWAPPCASRYQAYYRRYDLTGTLQHDQLGRKVASSNTDYGLTSPGVGWVTAGAYVCNGTQGTTQVLVQRLTLAGDTGRAWLVTQATSTAFPTALLAQGNKLVTGGDVKNIGQTDQVFQLTCSDTLGNVRWIHTYPNGPFANDYASALAPTPYKGYLLSGDGLNTTSASFSHYVVETDSMGVFRRSRLYQPLGPGYPSGDRLTNQCNVLALPNGGGYLLSGMADSTRNSQRFRKGYIMRLDTALNVLWVHKDMATPSRAFRLRLLPNGTVGLLFTDGVNNTLFLTQLDIATGQRVQDYTLVSPTQAGIVPTDWQWVGDGTLLLCGKSRPSSQAFMRSYIARWDFNGTPLAARTAREASARAVFYAYPNPASGPLTVHWQLPVGQRAQELRLYSPLGQLVRRLPLPSTSAGQLEVTGLAPGLYIARLADVAGSSQSKAVRLVVE